MKYDVKGAAKTEEIWELGGEAQVASTDGVERNVITNSSTFRPQSTPLPAR